MTTKKYFTKYLPVEGEIEEKDHSPVMRNGKITFLNLKGRMEALHSLIGYKEGNYKPAKLFLCSRDKEVGDTLMDNEGKTFEYTQSMAETCSTEDCIKVIGEVSPNALGYVREEQEFEEEDTKFSHYRLKYITETKVYKIKGPCGHFH